MRRYPVFLALATLVSLAVLLAVRTPAAGAGQAGAPALQAKTTVLVTFLGLVAFADGPEKHETRALFVDARGPERKISDPTGCPIHIPRHKAMVSVFPEGRDVPEAAGWVMNGDDITIAATAPRQPKKRAPVPGTVRMKEQLGLELKEELLGDPLPKALVGRVTFSGGRFVLEDPPLGDVLVKRLVGNGSPVHVRDARLELKYRIDADDVTIHRAAGEPIDLKGGTWHVRISNAPVRMAKGCGVVNPRFVDVHFDWLFALAKNPPEPGERRYPHMPPDTLMPGDPCLGGDF